MAVTTRYSSPEKAFSWSYSKLKNYEVCPKRHYHHDVAKDIKDEGEALLYGNRVHKMFEERLGPKQVPFPKEYAQDFEPWAQRFLNGIGDLKVEQQLAITKDYAPCDWFGKEAWYRAKGDVIKVHGPVAIVADWKTGKVVEDSVQLMLTAACVFYHYPEVQVVRSMFVWLKEDADTVETIKRQDLIGFWNNMHDRIEALRLATVNKEYPPYPNRLCQNFCRVTSCVYHGKRN